MKFSKFLSAVLALIMIAAMIPASVIPVSAASYKDDFIFLGAEDIKGATTSGDVGTIYTDNGVSILKVNASNVRKGNALCIYYKNAGVPDTGDGSFYDYPYYVMRYKTVGNARTDNDTTNLRGNNPADLNEKNEPRGYEKYGGSEQITKSDEFVVKIIDRDSYKKGTTDDVLADKSWTNQYMQLKVFNETNYEGGEFHIDFLAAFRTLADIEAFKVDLANGTFVRPGSGSQGGEGTGGVEISENMTYLPVQKTINVTVDTGSANYLSARALNTSSAFTLTTDMTKELVEKNGEEYLNISLPAGTYSNNSAYITLNGLLTPFNLVEYPYMKLVYHADYDKTMDLSIGGFNSPALDKAVETWIKTGSNPSADSTGKDKEYIFDIRNLNAKCEITSDYTALPLRIKIYGSSDKTTTVESNLYIKYWAFFKTEEEALAFAPTSSASIDLGELSVTEIIAAAEENGADYIDLQLLGANSKASAEIKLPESFTSAVADKGLDLGLVFNNTKISFNETELSKLTSAGDVTLNAIFGENDTSFEINTDAGTLKNIRARVYFDRNDTTSNYILNSADSPIGACAPINSKPAAYITLPANLSISETSEKVFSDTANHWGSSYISFVYNRGLFKGISEIEFAPNASMTRSMLAVVLMRLSGDNTAPADCFGDVSADKWYANGAKWAYDNKIVDTSKKFRPDENATREELVGMIYNSAKYLGLDTTASELTFTDADSISAEYKDAVAYCAEKGIVGGYDDNTFKGTNLATRAEVSTVISRFVNTIVKRNEIDLNDYTQDKIPFDENNIVLTFALMSDVHIENANENHGAAKNYKSAVENSIALSQAGKLDVVFTIGDVNQNVFNTESKRATEINAFKTLSDQFIPKETPLIFCTGNHDAGYEDLYIDAFSATEEDIDRYFKYDVDKDVLTRKDGNRHAVVNGYHFISVAMHGDYMSYMKPILDELTAEDPLKPVFVGYHYPASSTVYTTNYYGGENNLRALLNNYPQVVFFSGHTHAAYENDRTIWQDTFTAIDTASVRYIDDNGLINSKVKIPINAEHSEIYGGTSESAIVEVDKDNNIRIRAFNNFRDDIIAEYKIAAPNENNTHLLTYTQARKASNKAPVFAKNAEFRLTKKSEDAIGVYFDIAKHDDIVWYYTMEFSAEGQETEKFYFTPRHFDKNGVPDVIDCTLYSDAYYHSINDNHKSGQGAGGHTLVSGVSYKVTLTPYNVWDTPGTPLVIDSYIA